VPLFGEESCAAAGSRSSRSGALGSNGGGVSLADPPQPTMMDQVRSASFAKALLERDMPSR
jgi:hypothetical protein